MPKTIAAIPSSKSNAMPQFIKIDIDGPIAVLTLNRPEKRNALCDSLLEELAAFFSHIPAECRCIILQGNGSHFCAGLDLHELIATRSPDPIISMRRSKNWHSVFNLLEFSEVPVISILKGGVIGGGFEMAAATHVRIAVAGTFFQLPEGQRGIFLGGGGSVRIPRLIGSSRTIEMMLTGRQLNAQEGERLGIAHYVVADEESAMDKALEVARQIASNAPTSNYAIINGLPLIHEMGRAEGSFVETMVCAMTRQSGDSSNRIRDFFAGREKK